ncbi:DUF4214 domain-containing protein [Subtercola sp. PAMC28395]|uniref:DUF4214 domain-containing protein n=1 Tax=Subtercola sp. PAMC28395 TaxID=2846775 RepID=UPI001C0E2C2B|nr:DUF4214 domain-containing protein [Subtercola sp. PAMC28395]QWT24324.1 DUF4214 domain-containing protein [Subtercola sp. PAMC28395]
MTRLNRVSIAVTIALVAGLGGVGVQPAFAQPTPTPSVAPSAAASTAPLPTATEAPAPTPTPTPDAVPPSPGTPATGSPQPIATTTPTPTAQPTIVPTPVKSAQPAAPTPTPTTSTQAVGTPLVSNDPHELAQALVDAKTAGALRTNPPAIFDREIAPLAQGQALTGCTVDTRILQIIVLTLYKFGSVTISDIQRPCIGDQTNCGPPTYSVHCTDPARAVDFAVVGGVVLNGSNSQTIQLLKLLDSVVPDGTNAGQYQCRVSAGTSLYLVNINQFSDSCNHEHIDFRNTNVPLNLAAIGAGVNVLSASGSYVTALYNDYLARTPAFSELMFWTKILDGGGARTAVSDAFVSSDEYRLIRINAAYRGILGRGSDPGGQTFWLTRMQQGLLTTDDIETSFYGSLEYFTNHGGTNLSFAQSLYQTLLKRSGGASEYQFWADLAQSHGRDWVIAQFWDSTETISSRVSSMYSAYLGRVPDPAGLQNWVGLALKIGDSGLRSGLTGSDEYWSRAATRFH